MTTFGQVLKKLRNNAGISQSELSKHIGVSKSSVNMYERGEREPNFETLEAIADFFGVDMNTLISNEKAQYSHYSTLSDTYYHSVINWSADKFFTVDETTTIRMHFADLLLRYKRLIENTSKNKLDLKRYLKAIAPFNSESDTPLSTEKLIEQYWNQTLRHDLDDLKGWIDAFAIHLSKTMADGDIAGSTPTEKRATEVEEWQVEEYRRRLLSEQLRPEQKKMPTPVSEDGQDDLEEFVRKYKKNLTAGQEQQILKMMQAMITSQKQPQSVSAQQTVDEISPKK